MTLFPHRRSSCALALMMTLLLVGCGSDSETTTAEGPDDSVDLSSDDQALTWYKDIKPLMKDNIVRLLHTTPGRVNVKARTHEKVDSVGESRALSCHVVVILERAA